MTHPKIIEHEAISMAELRDVLKDIKKRDGELSFRGQKTEEYLEQVGTLKHKDEKELYEKLKKIDIPRFKDEHINKLIDILPANANELKMVIQGYALTVTAENLAKIQKAIDEFVGKRSEPVPMKIEPVAEPVADAELAPQPETPAPTP